MSDMIAQFIADTLAGAGGEIELQRNKLADRFNCVPSQINYVISTRFSPERGYTVESRRGGGGYIRITRVSMDCPSALMHAVNSIGDSLDYQTAAAMIRNIAASGIMSPGEANIIMAAVSNNALAPVRPPDRSKLRARIMKICLLTLDKRL